MARRYRTGKKKEILNKGETYDKEKDTYRYTYHDSQGMRRSIYAKDLAKLRERIKDVFKNQLDGIDSYAAGKVTINYVFDRYMETKTELRGTTRTNYLYMYDNFIREGFGKRKIAGIKYSDVLLFYKDLVEVKGMKINTVDSIHTLLHPTFQMAVRDDIIRKNPSDGAMAELKKKLPKNSGVRNALTLEQERAFLNFLNDEKNLRWKPFFTVMFGTGARIGELVALRWKDLDFENRVITIDHKITYYPRSDKSYKCEYELSLPKTEAGIRTIPMLDVVYDAFMEEKEYQNFTGQKCVSNIGGMEGFIFFNRFCTIHNAASVNRVIKRLVDDHNAREEVIAKREHREPVMIPRFSNHIARHTFCTRLCENDTNVKVIQQIMGHKDIQTTLDIYAEVSKQKQQEVFKELNKKDVI